MECGDITSSQEELLARAPFLGGMGARAFFAAERLSRLRKVVEMDCGDITSSQEELLARTPFLGGVSGGEEEAEVFSTPPLTHGHHQGEGEDKEDGDAITMCSLPFTQTQTQTQPSPSPSPEEEPAVIRPRKPRVCIRKVRGARIRTPTPSPDGRRGGGGTGSSSGGGDVDPLYRAVLMIPTPPAPHTAAEDILTLARQCGIF